MLPSLKSLLDLIPGVFDTLKIRFSTDGEFVFIIKVVKRDGVLDITTEPALDVTGIAESLDSLVYKEGTVYEFEFNCGGLKVCRINGDVTVPARSTTLLDFLIQVAPSCHNAADIIAKRLNGLPSVEELRGFVSRQLDKRFAYTHATGDDKAFIIDPTHVVVIDMQEAEAISLPIPAGFLEFCRQTDDEETFKRRVELEAVREDWTAFIVSISMDRSDSFFPFISAIFTAAIETMLPDLVRERREAFRVREAQGFMVTSQSANGDDLPN